MGGTAVGRFLEGTHGALLAREAGQPALLKRLGEGRARGIPSEAAELAFAALGSDSPRLFRNTPHASGDRGRITTTTQNLGRRGRHRASPADYERSRKKHSGAKSWPTHHLRTTVAVAVHEKTGAEAPVFSFKPVEVTD